MIPMVLIEPENLTADGLAKHYTRIALAHARRLDDLVAGVGDPARIDDVANAMVGRTAAVFLLRELGQIHGGDLIARRMWDLLGDGSEVEEFLATCAEEYGLDGMGA